MTPMSEDHQTELRQLREKRKCLPSVLTYFRDGVYAGELVDCETGNVVDLDHEEMEAFVALANACPWLLDAAERGHSLAAIVTAYETLHWQLVDLFDKEARGVSPMHFAIERVKELQSQLTTLTAENARLKQQIGGVQGALADAGDVLCFREDEDYGSSVRQVIEERDKLREQLAAKERDSKRLDYLDALVKHPPFRCDVILQHDHEDGVWLASIERGRAYGVTPIDSDISTPHLDVRAAIDSAAKERPLNIAPAAEGGDGARHP